MLRKYPTQPGRVRRGPYRTRRLASLLDNLSGPQQVLLSGVVGIGLGLAAVGLGSDGRGKLISYLGLNAFSSCNIKGNTSVSSGERIYHLPNQEYYDATFINLFKGERFFCSEAEAREAGWRRAGR